MEKSSITHFTISKQNNIENPNTGDKIMYYIGLKIISFSITGIMFIKNKKIK